MNGFEVTSLSSKGQVVIPGKIREELGIDVGAKLVVFTDGTNLLLKPIEAPKADVFKKLIAESRNWAKKSKMTKTDIAKAIKKVRNARRH